MKKLPLRPGGLAITKQAADYIGLAKNNTVLDVGCGIGETLAFLHQAYGCRVFGVDQSKKAISLAKKQLPFATLQVSDAAFLPFEKESFDAVFMECTLSLFSNPDNALSEAYRCLRPGGFLAISTLSKEEGSALSFQHCISLSVLKKTLSNLGFTNLHIINCTDALVQYVCDIIFTYGSLENYKKSMEQEIGGLVLCEEISPKDVGYHLIIAVRQ